MIAQILSPFLYACCCTLLKSAGDLLDVFVFVIVIKLYSN